MNQLQIDFTNAPFRIANNAESTAMNEQHHDHLNKQCKMFYDLLKQNPGGVTFAEAFAAGISDARRRAKDLTDIYHITVYKDFVPGTRFKKFSLKPFIKVYTTN